MQQPKLRILFLTVLTATTLALTGCVADEEVADDLPDQGSVPTHVSEVEFPDTEVARTSKWVVDEINGSRAINKQDWYPRAAPELTEKIPVDSLVGTLNSQLRPSLPYVPSDYHEPEANYGVTRLTPGLTAEPVDLHIQVDDSGMIRDLWYETVETDATTTEDDGAQIQDDDAETPATGLGN